MNSVAGHYAVLTALTLFSCI